MSIEEVVNVQITRETAAVSQAGFNTALILAPHVAFTERLRYYADMDGVLADFDSNDPVSLCASAIFSQNPNVNRIAVGRQQVNTVDIVFTIASPTAVETFTWKINGEQQTFTSDATPTEAEVEAGIIAAVNAGTPPVTATDPLLTNTVRITADVAGVAFSFVPVTSNLSLSLNYATGRGTGASEIKTLTAAATETGANIGDALQAVENENNDWYGVLVIDMQQASVLAAVAWVEARRKLNGTVVPTGTGDADPKAAFLPTSTDIAAQLRNLNRARTYDIFSYNPQQFSDAAWMGDQFPYDPGTTTWKFKTLGGVTVDTLTSTESTNLRGSNGTGRNANTYERMGGRDITREGRVASGEYIDVIIFVDWLQARMTERIFAVFANSLKLPLNDAGVQAIVTEVRAQLSDGVAVGGLLPDFEVTFPLVKDIPLNDRANRFLPDIRFRATLAGAIHATEIVGTVSV
jgi:hypothetical protein